MMLRCAPVAVMLSAIACGVTPPPAGAPASRPMAEPPPAPASEPAAASAPKPPFDREQAFLRTCGMGTSNSEEYCACAWGEFRGAFSEEEMAAGIMPAARLDKLKTRVLTICASKVDEPRARAKFGASCAGEQAELEPFCACTWTELRKRFSAAELNDEATLASERVVTARGPVIKVCASKMPERVSRAAFMKGCTTDPAVEAFCDCVWKELRKQASPAQIESGTFDQKTLFGRVEKTCSKLRPAKP